MGAEDRRVEDNDPELIAENTLPDDLEELCVARFDELVANEQLIYEDSTAETVDDQGFKVSLLHLT